MPSISPRVRAAGRFGDTRNGEKQIPLLTQRWVIIEEFGESRDALGIVLQSKDSRKIVASIDAITSAEMMGARADALLLFGNTHLDKTTLASTRSL